MMSGVAGKDASCDAGIPCVHQFESWLLNFQSSSLLVHLGKRGSKFLGPCSHVRDPKELPVFWLWPALLLEVMDIWRVKQMEDISLCVVIFYIYTYFTYTAFKINRALKIC